MKTTTRTPGSLPTGQTAEKGFRSSWNGSRYREFLLLIAPLLLFSAYPLLRSFEHAGNSGVFGGVRMTGALIALLSLALLAVGLWPNLISTRVGPWLLTMLGEAPWQ